MSEEKKLLEQLSDLIKELPAALQGPVVLARSEIVTLEANLRDLRTQFHAQVSSNSGLREIQTQLQDNNDDLRDRLHASELEAARLRGYRERVNEFDPVTDRDQYEDRLPRPRRGNDNQYDAMAMAAERSPSWYHRRRA